MTLVWNNIRELKFLLQTNLPYILQTVVCVHTTTNLPSSPYAFYKANMLLLYYIMSSILKPFTIFSPIT